MDGDFPTDRSYDFLLCMRWDALRNAIHHAVPVLRQHSYALSLIEVVFNVTYGLRLHWNYVYFISHDQFYGTKMSFLKNNTWS